MIKKLIEKRAAKKLARKQRLCSHEKSGQIDIFMFCLDCGKNLGSPYEGRKIIGDSTDMKTGVSTPKTWVVRNGALVEV